MDKRIENLAKILVNYSVEVGQGDWVHVRAHTLALPLATAVIQNILLAGGHYTLSLENEEITESFLKGANDAQLEWVAPSDKLIMENIDALINLRAAENTRSLSGIEPKRQRKRQHALREITSTYLNRAAEGKLRWTVTNFPCSAFAQEADMSLREYQEFVYAATFADRDDPIRAWKEVEAQQQKVVEWLQGKKQVVIRGANSDLSLSIEGRRFINSCGKKNLPDGEIFTGPVEDSVNGWVRFTYPAIANGREVEGVELQFKDGQVVKATAKKNQDYLNSMLEIDPGARYLGEFAIGTNYQIQKFTKNILYDEKIGGSFHLALGAGYPETGSKNKSSIHWDFICDLREKSEILVDDELFYKDGKFVV